MGASSIQDITGRKFWTAQFAEFLGTMLLVIFTCGSTAWGDNVQIALSFGFTVASLVWALGRVSGGHINPAVTMGFLVTRRICVARGLFYIIMQTLGALAGGALLKAMSPSGSGVGAVYLATGVDAGQGFAIEMFCCFALVLVVFSSVDGNRNDLGGSIPLTVGLTVAMCHLWGVKRTGCGMNPARSTGAALAADLWDDHWLYWVGPLFGGSLGGIIYEFLFAVNATPAKLRGFFSRGYDNDNYDERGECLSSAKTVKVKECSSDPS